MMKCLDDRNYHRECRSEGTRRARTSTTPTSARLAKWCARKLSSNFRVACELLTELKARANRADFNLTDNDFPWASLRTEFLRWAKQSVRNPHEYERDLDKFEEYLAVRSIRQVTPDYVVGFREWRLGQNGLGGRKISPRTVNKQVCTLNNMLNKGVEWKRIGSNAIKDLKPLRNDAPAKQRRSLTVEEVELLFGESPEFLKPVCACSPP